jgi:ketosteroid isomerase-like protein
VTRGTLHRKRECSENAAPMSRSNVELARSAFEVFLEGLSTGNPAAPFDEGFNASDAEWVMPPNSPGFRQVYRGREGFLEFMRTWTEDFDWEIELERVVAVGDDRAVAVFQQRAIGKSSRVPVELRMALLYEFCDGLITRMTNYLDPADAFRAAGISE